MQRDNPPRPLGDPDRAAGPQGTRGTSRGSPGIDDPPRPLSTQVELRSSAFNDHTLIPDRYSYAGGNMSPPLEWGGIPDGTSELVLLCEDPDAPNGTFVHWVVTGISPSSTGVGEGESPGGSPGRNGFGELGWGGPQPPVGDEPHRYFFQLYAVDQPLGLVEAPGAEHVHAAMEGHVLAHGNLVGLFAR
ncbi:YbhB/YbcL family Raf kinase inhibitor-like protein [Amycolatopsis marina]|uniref:YbhB/YbcL family Raf kinase inhibitor-like protein n=1 Tax=Amycolatopsis marina TaxID=490629 RepID=UPI001FEC2F08|nr:YbhB/YbcL family Raf kinase inhibitor-like protein [Amycolatopsis marina]